MYNTWTDRIWPEIRVSPSPEERAEEAEPGFTPMHPDCLTAPEMAQKIESLTQNLARALERVKVFRRESPGRFCLVSSLACLTLAYIGKL